MERAGESLHTERGEREAGACSRPLEPDSAVPVPMFDVADGRGRLAAAASVCEPLLPKERFTVRLKDGQRWTAARRPHETLQAFVAAVERNAHLLNLIGDDEHVLRLQLPGPDGSSPTDLEVDATMGDVRICMGCCDDPVLLAVIGKLPTGPRHGTPPPRPEPDSREQVSVPVSAGARAIVPEYRTPENRTPAARPKGQPSSSSRPAAPSPPASPERSVSIKRRFDPDLLVTESDLTSNPHFTLKEKADSLSISLTALKNARIELGLGRWMGRQERARLRREREPSEESRRSPVPAEPEAKRARPEAHEVLGSCSCKQEVP